MTCLYCATESAIRRYLARPSLRARAYAATLFNAAFNFVQRTLGTEEFDQIEQETALATLNCPRHGRSSGIYHFLRLLALTATLFDRAALIPLASERRQ